MTQITREWIAKAEGDFTSALRMLRARKYPNYEAACFHAHESAEKYLKARLQEAGIEFERTLALNKTMKLALAIEPEWKTLKPEFSRLLPYTQDYLYPGKEASKVEAQRAIESCRQVRKIIRAVFGLPA